MRETTMDESSSSRLNRRQLLSLLGAGAGIGLFSGLRPEATLLAAAQAGAVKPVTFPKGAIIRTVFKDIPPDQFPNGTILFHEHLDGVYNRDSRQLTLPPPSNQDIAPAIADIKEAMKGGVVAIVDGGHPDMGTNYEHLRQIATATGLEVVCSGGYYVNNTYPAEIDKMSDDQIADSLVKEAAAGRYGAYGEIGSMPAEADFTLLEKKVYRGVGKAHLKNNLPIFTHNNYGTGPEVPRDIALKQLDIYESVGVKPSGIAIGHMDSLAGKNADMIIALGKRGAWVGIDRVRGDEKGDEDRVALVHAFLDAGYLGQLLLSSDTRRNYGQVTRFAKQLRASGISEATLHTILADNPRRFLAFVPKNA